MSLNDILIVKVKGGLGRLAPSTDGICGLIATGFAVSGGVQTKKAYRFQSVADAVSIGITAEYDSTNKVLVYEHISEFFRDNSNAVLWFWLDAIGVYFEDMFDVADEQSSANRLKAASDGTITIMGAVWSPDPDPATTEDPITDATVLLAGIASAQMWAQESASLHEPLVVILEGRAKLEGTENFHDLNAPLVTAFFGQNYSVVEANELNETYAAVGTVLNALSRASVNENISYVRKFNMLGGSLQRTSILAENEFPISTLNQLNDLGVAFFRKHTGIAGIYFNDAFTCTALTDDYCYIENNRTINKAMRLIRSALLPDLGSSINVNPTTGQLAAEVVKKLEVQGKRAIEEQMLNQGEISGFTFRIDENQNILSTNELEAELEIVPTGTARKWIIKIGFTNPF